MVEHLRDLVPDKHNARRHSPRNIGMIADALREVGAARSIVISEDNTILAGNGVVEAAAEAGIERVKVVEATGNEIIAVRRTGLTPEQKTRLALFDNRASDLSDWDADVLAGLQDDGVDLSGLWGKDELAELLADAATGTDGLTDPDAVPAVPETPITQPGDLWRLGRHRLLCGDSRVAADIERLMGGERAAMVWTDPPYGVALGDKNKWLNSIGRANRVEENLENDTLNESDLLQLLRDAFSLAAASCTAGAAWYVAAPPGPLHLLFGQALKELGIWRQTLQWVKNNATFAPLGVSYHWRAEPIFYGWLPNGPHAFYGDRKQTTVWEVDRPMASPEHPTMKPVELVAKAIEHSTRVGGLVLDMFLGSGSTVMAAEQLGRVCYGMEIDPHYCDVIVRRWEDFTGETASRIPAEAEVPA